MFNAETAVEADTTGLGTWRGLEEDDRATWGAADPTYTLTRRNHESNSPNSFSPHNSHLKSGDPGKRLFFCLSFSMANE